MNAFRHLLLFENVLLLQRFVFWKLHHVQDLTKQVFELHLKLTQSQLEVPTLDHQEMIEGGRETTEEPKQGDPAWQLREKGPDLKRRGGEDHCPGPEEHHPQAAKEDEEIDSTIAGTEATVTKSISRKGGGAAGTRRRDRKDGSESHKR